MTRALGPFAVGVILLLFALAIPARAQSTEALSPTYRAAIIKMLDLTNAGALMEGMVGQMWIGMEPAIRAQFRRAAEAEGKRPNEERLNAFITRLGQEFSTEFGQEIDSAVPLMVKAYSKHLTLEEVEYLNWVYSQPTVQKIVQLQPVIMQEMSGEMQAWGAAAGERAMQRALDRMMAEGAGPETSVQ